MAEWDKSTERLPRRLRVPLVGIGTAAVAASSLAWAGPAHAGPAVGSACAYRTNVSLFGGPYSVRGCGQSIPPGDAGSASPSVTLSGSATDADGAKGVYGPAVIFGGQYDANDNVGPSGQLSASSTGSSTVTSSASAATVGPAPFHADFVRALCTASNQSRTYQVTLTNAVVETSTDAEGYPLTTQTVTNPPPNYTVAYEMNNIGDRGIIVFNERLTNPNGSVTLNAVHMYMQGPIAFGDMVIGSATCGH